MPDIKLSVGANTLEKVGSAVSEGADSVFAGLEGYTLEADSLAFKTDELESIIEYSHKNNVEVFCTLDRFLHNSELASLDKKLLSIRSLPFDAFIIADIGIIETVRKHFPSAKLHLSEFANCVNSLSAASFASLGFDTIIPGHESSLKEITRIVKECPSVKFEIPVHGVMCISYSGRTLISSHLASGVHSNAYELALEEDQRRSLYCPVEQKDGFLTIFSSRELCMADHIKEIKESGVAQIRVQTGKNSAQYIRNAVGLYKNAIKSNDFDLKPELSEKLHSTHYTTGFYFKNGPVDTI